MRSILPFLQNWGVTGLLLAMFLEGASLPVPGLALVLALSTLLHPDLKYILLLAMGMSLSYTIASYIPYYFAKTIEARGHNKLNHKMQKACRFFSRYGELSICLSRPFMLGNYISYIAGLSNINPNRYGLLTFVGIFPWALAVLLLSVVCHGNIISFHDLLTRQSTTLLVTIIGLTISLLCIFPVLLKLLRKYFYQLLVDKSVK